jgi:hypothetical protein
MVVISSTLVNISLVIVLGAPACESQMVHGQEEVASIEAMT